MGKKQAVLISSDSEDSDSAPDYGLPGPADMSESERAKDMLHHKHGTLDDSIVVL